MLEEGLQDITRETTDATIPLYHDKAAISLVRAFHRTAQACKIDAGPVHYYAFGWSGGLSESWRNIESEMLYASLCKMHDELRAQYPGKKIKLELYAHSHGGQLIAHLAVVHKKVKHPHLHVDLAVLCATPIYRAKVLPMVSSSLFSMVLNMHSHGDKVQTLDFVSTPGHHCVRACEDLQIPLARGNCPGPIIADVCLAVHGSAKVFSHSNFFSFSTYRLPSYLRKRKHIRNALNLFAPMPILVLYPTIAHRLEKALTKPGYHNVVVNMEHEKNKNLSINSYKYVSRNKVTKLHATDYYAIKELNENFVYEFSRRARKTAMHHFKMTFYYMMNA